MRILLVTQYFYPEVFKSNDIAFELAKRGHHVDALVGIPNYPDGIYFKGYGILKKRKEVIYGVNVYRSFQFSRGKGGKRLMLNYVSYVISACLNVLFIFVWKKKYDAVIVHETSPIFQALPAILYSKIVKVPLYMWVLDIWPDAMRSGGGISNQYILSFVDSIVKYIYKRCDKILISSRRMSESILAKGDFEDRIIYFPNWSDDLLKMNKNYDIPTLPIGFKIMIAGNLGKSQNLDAVAEVMTLTRDIEEIKWIFVGDGSYKEWLEQYIKEHGLEDRALCLGRFPFSAMPAFYSQADAMLVTLRPGFPHLDMVVPARLQSYMSAGRPILAMIGSGGADIIDEAHCGKHVPAGDAQGLADLIREEVLPHKDVFEEMGRNGRKYYEENYTMDMCMDNLERIISND